MSFITSQSLCEEPAVRIPVAQEPASDLNRLFWTRSLMRVLGKLLAGLSKVMTRDSSATTASACSHMWFSLHGLPLHGLSVLVICYLTSQ